jgi:hypothetical protein
MKITVTDARSATTVYTTGRDGRAIFKLAIGQYSVKTTCGQPKRVTVNGEAVSVDLTCVAA